MGGSILIVDDHKLGADAFGALLRMEGYVVAVAHDGNEALALLQGGFRPDLIILDLVMPVMDGRAFRMAQRDDPEIADIPVYVFSTGAEDPIIAELGAVGGQRKPCAVPVLLADIAFHMGLPPHGRRRIEIVRDS
ncbi:MAG TPA: response regulator [Azospirillaceae bacterium]|nr:response regulator [Azospirillaceae bacterium]